MTQRLVRKEACHVTVQEKSRGERVFGVEGGGGWVGGRRRNRGGGDDRREEEEEVEP